MRHRRNITETSNEKGLIQEKNKKTQSLAKEILGEGLKDNHEKRKELLLMVTSRGFWVKKEEVKGTAHPKHA